MMPNLGSQAKPSLKVMQLVDIVKNYTVSAMQYDQSMLTIDELARGDMRYKGDMVSDHVWDEISNQVWSPIDEAVLFLVWGQFQIDILSFLKRD